MYLKQRNCLIPTIAKSLTYPRQINCAIPAIDTGILRQHDRRAHDGGAQSRFQATPTTQRRRQQQPKKMATTTTTTASPAMAVYPSAPPSSVAQDSIITTSVTVTVTIGAVKKHLVSYWFLWFLYLLATLLCAHQVFRDKRSVIHKSQRDVESHNTTNTNGPHESSSGDTTRKMVKIYIH